MNQNLRKVLQYALSEIYRSLREKQEQILLTDKFGFEEAVCNPIFFSVIDIEKNRHLYSDIYEEYRNLREFAANIEKMLKEDDDRAWQTMVDAFFNSKK